MDYIYEYLEKLGYVINKNYYSFIDQWEKIWKGKADWLELQTTSNKQFKMYSLGMGKKVCEDLASVITSEPFVVKTKTKTKMEELLSNAKIISKLPKEIEKMAYSGTVGSIARITNATLEGSGKNAVLRKNKKTKIKTFSVTADRIIPLRIEDGEIIDCAFTSTLRKQIEGKTKNIVYLETHILEDKGYQVTNKYFDAENGKEVKMDGVIETYNTLSHVPLFNIAKLPKENPIEDNNGLGIALYGESIDQLQLLDLTYNNFGADFKLGQKIMIINKKLTQVITEDYEDSNGVTKTRQRIVYPTDVQKQLYQEVGTGIMDANTNQAPYIYEYNPDLRVGDNKEGVQFALDNLSFKIGFGTRYYSFENGTLNTATEAVYSHQDFVNNGNKIRRAINEYLIGICRSLLLCEQMLGNTNANPEQKIEVQEVDGFLEDDNTMRERIRSDAAAGFISRTTYLMKAYGYTEEEAKKEGQRLDEEAGLKEPNIEDEDTEE